MFLRAFLTLLVFMSVEVMAAQEASWPQYTWPHSGPLGTIDKAAAQRGLQVYQNICSTCHSLTRVAFRHLSGIGFTEQQIKMFAAEHRITDRYDENGQEFERAGKPFDFFPNPYENDVIGRLANNGVLPPDLSLIAAARQGGEDYIVSFLTGYTPPPEGVTLNLGQYYNKYYPGHLVSMPQMIFEGGLSYSDGTPATVLQQAKDVATFLVFTADPHHDFRKQLGVRVLLFLLVFTGLVFFAKRQLWRDVEH